jgi:hypothetical protein
MTYRRKSELNQPVEVGCWIHALGYQTEARGRWESGLWKVLSLKRGVDATCRGSNVTRFVDMTRETLLIARKFVDRGLRSLRVEKS